MVVLCSYCPGGRFRGSLMLIFNPLDKIMSPGIWPGLHGESHFASMVALPSRTPPRGGSYVEDVSTRYAESNLPVNTECVVEVISPNLHTESTVSVSPSRFMSLRLQALFAAPCAACCTALSVFSSMQSCTTCG